MSMGIPVLCSRGTALPEVAGDAALFFDPESPDAIEASIARIAADSQLRITLIERGYQRSAEFGSARTMASQYLDVFSASLAEHVGRLREYAG